MHCCCCSSSLALSLHAVLFLRLRFTRFSCTGAFLRVTHSTTRHPPYDWSIVFFVGQQHTDSARVRILIDMATIVVLVMVVVIVVGLGVVGRRNLTTTEGRKGGRWVGGVSCADMRGVVGRNGTGRTPGLRQGGVSTRFYSGENISQEGEKLTSIRGSNLDT